MREQQSTKAVFNKAIQHVQSSNATRVGDVYLALGELAELDQMLIQNCWDELSKGTSLEHAKLHFRLITGQAQCMACFKKYHPENGVICCPNCGSFGAKILSGEEFYFESIETNDE